VEERNEFSKNRKLPLHEWGKPDVDGRRGVSFVHQFYVQRFKKAD